VKAPTAKPRLAWDRILLAAPSAIVALSVASLPLILPDSSEKFEASVDPDSAAAFLLSPEPDYRAAMIHARMASPGTDPAKLGREGRTLEALALLASEFQLRDDSTRWHREGVARFKRFAAAPDSPPTAPFLAPWVLFGRLSQDEWREIAAARTQLPQDDPLTTAWLAVVCGNTDAALPKLRELAASSHQASLLAAIAAHARQDTALRDQLLSPLLADTANPPPSATEKAAAHFLSGNWQTAWQLASDAPESEEPVRSAALAEIASRWLQSGEFTSNTDTKAKAILAVGLRAAPARPNLAVAAARLAFEGPPVTPAAGETEALDLLLGAFQAAQRNDSAQTTELLKRAVSLWPESVLCINRLATGIPKESPFRAAIDLVATSTVRPSFTSLRRRTLSTDQVPPATALLWRSDG
jgi:hypothetical protein